MEKGFLQIDVSNSRNQVEEDIIEIKFEDEDVLQVHFSKLIRQSKYIRDKYKYSEALDLIQSEIEEIKVKFNIKEESIKHFIELLKEEKVNIPIEQYKDIYTLSEYFSISSFTSVLDNISCKALFKDLDFTIQFLHDSEASCSSIDSKFNSKIENFLRLRINECIENAKFKTLPVSMICRIIELSKDNVDHNLLIDFIVESIKSRFILLKFVDFNKLTDDKFNELIKYIDKQEGLSKNMFLEYIPFNFSFIKSFKNKYDQIVDEMNQTKLELNETTQEFHQTKQELNKTKQELNQTKQELNQTNQEFHQTKQELNETKQELNQIKQELNQAKQELNETNQEFQQAKKELNQTNQELNQAKQELNETKQELNQTKQELNETKQEFQQTKQELNETKQELNETKQELNETKQELNETKQELSQTNQAFNQTNQELNQTNQEFYQTKQELNETKQELNQTKQELSQIKQEFDQTIVELSQTKQELNQTNYELNQAKQELNQSIKELGQYKKELKQDKDKKKQYMHSIIAGGYDLYNQLGIKPTNKGMYETPIIYPPVKLPLYHSSLLSYSVYSQHSVLVTTDGSLKGVGDNRNGQISSTLEKTIFTEFTDFSINDGNGVQMIPFSAVCYQYGTLYMFYKSTSINKHLVLCDCEMNGGNPVFLDIGNHQPVSLFGGCSYSAAIGSEGEVIFINRNSVKKWPNSPIEAVSLPEGEKASSIAFCNNLIVVLSSNGQMYTSPIEKESNAFNFSLVSELASIKIFGVSGISKHCLAVSKDGRVFGFGSNEGGKLGFGKGTVSVLSFLEILSLRKYKIRSVYAGCNHSLFETYEGKIFSCGYNDCGQLFLKNGPGENVYLPAETTIEGDSAFCIAGFDLNIIFVGIGAPKNTPNMPIQQS